MITPQFINISTGANMDLQAIVPTGDNTSDNVQIQTLDAFGRTVASYDWNDWNYDHACWVDGDLAEVEGVSFAPGQGLWVVGSATTQGIQSAGEVGSSDISVSLRVGATGTGNPFPVAVDLQDILAEGEDTSDNVQIQTLDAFGRTVDSYDWNDWNYDHACWVDGDLTEVTSVSILPGQGLWVVGSSTAQSIRFPAPTL